MNPRICVVTTSLSGEQSWSWFLSSAQVAEYIKNVRFAWGESIQAFPDKQIDEKITHIGEDLKKF